MTYCCVAKEASELREIAQKDWTRDTTRANPTNKAIFCSLYQQEKRQYVLRSSILLVRSLHSIYLRQLEMQFHED